MRPYRQHIGDSHTLLGGSKPIGQSPYIIQSFFIFPQISWRYETRQVSDNATKQKNNIFYWSLRRLHLNVKKVPMGSSSGMNWTRVVGGNHLGTGKLTIIIWSGDDDGDNHNDKEQKRKVMWHHNENFGGVDGAKWLDLFETEKGPKKRILQNYSTFLHI